MRRTRGRLRLSHAAVAVVLCVVLSGCSTPRQDDTSLGAGAPTASATSTTTPTPTPLPTAAPASPDPVPAAAPTHLTFAAASIDGPVEEYTAADAAAEGGINPATLDTISWYSGVPDPMPGTMAKNTVYLFGHAWIQPAVFNGLKDVQPGDQATVTTASGDLHYQVDEVITMAKSDFTQDSRVAAVVPGRLALVTCYRPEGWDPEAHAPDNTVVFLHLVGATPAA